MTGKEALIYVSKGLSALAFEEGKWKISERDNEALQVLRKIVQKYDKYKRAFEILKEELNIQIFYDDECCEPMWVLDGGGNKEITKEEYELLEELMRDDN